MLNLRLFKNNFHKILIQSNAGKNVSAENYIDYSNVDFDKVKRILLGDMTKD